MSGRMALKDSIHRLAKGHAERHQTVRRGHVETTGPLSVQMFEFSHVLHEHNDLLLSQWMKLYDHVVGIRKHDMVVVQQEGSDWIVMDVVSDRNVGKLFDKWGKNS